MENDVTKDIPIDSARVWQRHVDMAKLGATTDGGVRRPALMEEDIAAHVMLADLARARGFIFSIDPVGNMFIRRPGSDSDAAPVVSGSHSDTQLTGGRFDGIVGVLAAFEALEAIDDAGLATKRPIETVIWNNEEGARHLPSTMGSAVYGGKRPLADALASVDEDGVSMSECIARLRRALSDAGEQALGAPMAALVEAHIEQGPVLFDAGETIGIVTGMQGNRRFRVEVTGREDHSGTTPRSRRRDALIDAVNCVRALHGVFHDDEDIIRFTIGHFQIVPGAVTVVPGKVEFTIDFRHPEQATLDELGDRVLPTCQHASTDCAVAVTEISHAAPIEFTGPVIESCERATRQRGYSHRRIYSSAGHDCRYMVDLWPTGMIFIPCKDGISHNPAEDATSEDVAAGSQIVTDVLVDLANTL